MNDKHYLQLSIIVPVYNVEKYIRPCMESIFRQELDEDCFEVIIVNDGTQDRSMEVIQDIIEQHNNITVLNQANQGLSVARNNGIAMAKGEYILMPDSDDLLIENSLKPLLEKALESKADMVVADFLKSTNEKIQEFQSIAQKVFNIQEKTGEQLFIEDLNPHECFVWRTLYRRDFIIDRNIKFYPGIKFQDVPFTHECYLKAKKCLRISWFLIIYRKRLGSATSFYNDKNARDFCIAIAKTWNLGKENVLIPPIEKKLRDDVWTSFTEMIRKVCNHIDEPSTRKKIIDFMHSEAPDLDFHDGWKQKFLSHMYRNMPHAFISTFYIYMFIIEDRLLPFYKHRLKHLIEL